eukprot:Gb_03478 [translate_table: standard]
MSQVHPQQSVSLVHSYVVVNDQFCTGPDPAKLTVWKKSLLFSGNGFTVFDSTGNLVFRVDRYGSTVEGEVVLMDAVGKSLLTLRHKMPFLPHRWEGFHGDRVEGQKPAFTVKRSSMLGIKSPVQVFMSSGYLKKQSDYYVQGSFRERSCTIHSSDSTIAAQVSRKCATSKIMLERDVFSLVVQPGYDQAFIMGLIIVLDHLSHEDCIFL